MARDVCRWLVFDNNNIVATETKQGMAVVSFFLNFFNYRKPIIPLILYRRK